jgi:vanillate O-demethylase monooxygenase subunit
MENIMAPPFWRMALRGNGLADDVPVDRWQICRFTPPSHVLIEVGVAHAGKAATTRARAQGASIVVDFITPQPTPRSGTSGAWHATSPHDEALTANIREGQGKIFSEDLEMLERQQQNLLAHPSATCSS